MQKLQETFLDFIRRKNYQQGTLKEYIRGLNLFFAFLEENYPDISDIVEITRDAISSYEKHLASHKNAKGKLMSAARRRYYLHMVKEFFLYLEREEKIYTNPTVNIAYPKVRRKLVRDILSIDEMHDLLKACAGTTLMEIRDRAVLELLYSTGIRSNELRNVHVEDIDLAERTLFVRQGKFCKQRVVPFGEGAVYWIRRYLESVRPYISSNDSGILFVTMNGGRQISSSTLDFLIKRWIKKAGIEKKVTIHTFRHTCATHLLKHGADIRYVQKHLGHRCISTTEVYLKIEITDLKEIHEKCHPREQEDWDR